MGTCQEAHFKRVIIGKCRDQPPSACERAESNRPHGMGNRQVGKKAIGQYSTQTFREKSSERMCRNQNISIAFCNANAIRIQPNIASRSQTGKQIKSHFSTGFFCYDKLQSDLLLSPPYYLRLSFQTRFGILRDCLGMG